MFWLYMIIFSFSILGFGVYALIREPQITGYYEACQIYNRVYAFFAANIAIGFIETHLLMIPAILLYIWEELPSYTGESISFSELIQGLWQAASADPAELVKILISDLIAIGLTIYLYYRVYRKSPDFLKKRCLIDLTISGYGVMVRILLWFIRLFVETWWEFNRPQVYVLKSGRSVYAFPDGHVYDASNSKFGKMTDDKTAVIWDS